MPLPRLELETSGFDTMLGFMHQPDEPKSLSYWEDVGNPLILHNSIHCMDLLALSTPLTSKILAIFLFLLCMAKCCGVHPSCMKGNIIKGIHVP